MHVHGPDGAASTSSSSGSSQEAWQAAQAAAYEQRAEENEPLGAGRACSQGAGVAAASGQLPLGASLLSASAGVAAGVAVAAAAAACVASTGLASASGAAASSPLGAATLLALLSGGTWLPAVCLLLAYCAAFLAGHPQPRVRLAAEAINPMRKSVLRSLGVAVAAHYVCATVIAARAVPGLAGVEPAACVAFVVAAASLFILAWVDLRQRQTSKAVALGLDAISPSAAHPVMVVGAQEAARNLLLACAAAGSALHAASGAQAGAWPLAALHAAAVLGCIGIAGLLAQVE